MGKAKAKAPLFTLGASVIDTITGFKGIATAKIEYLHGTTQYEVTPMYVEGKDGGTKWILEGMLAYDVPSAPQES